MLGFYCDTFNDNQVNLMVHYVELSPDELEEYQQNGTTPNFYETDSIAEAMEHFNLYFNKGAIYKRTDEVIALNDLGINKEDASEFREKIDALIQNFDDETALNNVVLYPLWSAGTSYTIDTKLRYNGVLYKVLQTHTSAEEWAPDIATSLYAKVLTGETPEDIPDWEQPTGSNAYMTGDKVRFEGNIYVSLIDNNVWSPTAYPAGWELITE